MARPTKYTQPRRQAILDGLRAGLTRTAAAGRAGVHVTQLERWGERYASFATEMAVAEAEAEARFTATIAQAAAPHDVVETTTTLKTVFKTRRTQNKDGSITEEPVALQDKTETTNVKREFDWRAAESFLKRRRREDWGDNVAIDVDSEIKRLLAELAAAGETQTPG